MGGGCQIKLFRKKGAFPSGLMQGLSGTTAVHSVSALPHRALGVGHLPSQNHTDQKK